MFEPDDEIRFIFLPQVSPSCGPLFFSAWPEANVREIEVSGSFGLVDTGAKKILVTCCHVWKGFQEQRADAPNLKIFLGLGLERAVPLEAPPIDQDERLDLATFDMEPLLAACGRRRFFPLNPAPRDRLKKGDLLFFLGYPGCLRSVSGEAVHFGGTAYPIVLTGVDGCRFFADLRGGEPVRVRDAGVPPQQYRHPGISGSPCFAVRADRFAQLVGFTTSIWTDYLWFTHARCLNCDGTINRNPNTG